MSFLNKLFHYSNTPTDGLTQDEREAIVDLLNYCVIVDNNISSSEDSIVSSIEHKFHWDVNVDFNYFINKSVASARRVLEHRDNQADFLKQIQARLISKFSRETALTLVDKVVNADGRIVKIESQLRREIEILLKA